jgi:hypothetical protein
MRHGANAASSSILRSAALDGADDVSIPKICRISKWPTDPETWCWHCCHPCGRPPIPIPVAYDIKKNVFTVRGAFCSWGCLKAYSRDGYSSHRSSTMAMHVAIFRKRCQPGRKLEHTVPAPPRGLLKVFGGTLTIEEFRKASLDGDTYTILPPKMVPYIEIVEERRASSIARVPEKQDLTVSVDFQDVSGKNETLRLRRVNTTKKTSNSNMLERAMGISAFLQTGDVAPSTSS